MSILHTPVSQLRKLTKTVHHANLRFIGGASSQEFFIPPGSRLITLNAKSVIGDVEADLDGLTLRVSSALPDTQPTTEIFLRAGETRALTDQVGRNVVASVVDGWPEGVSKLYATLDMGGVASGSSSGGGGTALESETFFLTEGTEFVPKRSGLAFITAVGGGGAGQGCAAQPNLSSWGGAGGTSGAVVSATMRLEAGMRYSYSLGEGGISDGNAAGATVFHGPQTVTAPGGAAVDTQTNAILANLLLFRAPHRGPVGSSEGGGGAPYELMSSSDHSRARGGIGGASPFGQSGVPRTPPRGQAQHGPNATGYGAGGCGAAYSWMENAPALTGGAGAPGCIEIVMIYDTAGAGSSVQPVVYSEEEFFTGNFWIDGRPIYGRYVDIGTLATVTKDVPFDMTGIDIVVRSYGQVKEPHDGGFFYRTLPYAWTPVFINIIPSSSNMLPNTLRIGVHEYKPPSGTTAFAIIEYVRKT